jgi:hypothetical protein
VADQQPPAEEQFLTIVPKAALLAHSLHAAVHWQPGGSLLTSIVDRETSVNASEWIIFLYHPLAEVDEAERLHLQGSLVIAPAQQEHHLHLA